MTTSKRPDIDRLASAGQALLVSGAVGAIVGLITGLICGVFFFVVGALIGASWGVPTGFCVGVLASAIGGRHVWRVSGVLCGMLGALSLVAGFGEKSLAQNVVEMGWLGLVMIGVTGVGGFVAGGFADTQLSHSACGTGLFCRLAIVLDKVDLRKLSLPARLALALFELIPALCLLWQLTKSASQMIPSFGM